MYTPVWVTFPIQIYELHTSITTGIIVLMGLYYLGRFQESSVETYIISCNVFVLREFSQLLSRICSVNCWKKRLFWIHPAQCKTKKRICRLSTLGNAYTSSLDVLSHIQMRTYETPQANTAIQTSISFISSCEQIWFWVRKWMSFCTGVHITVVFASLLGMLLVPKSIYRYLSDAYTQWFHV